MDVLLVTIYNRSITDSSTVKSFLNECKKYHNRITLFVWDNSTDEAVRKVNNGYKPQVVDYVFYQAEHNTSLSKVYNTAICEAYQAQFLFNFDQDSVIDNHYFDVFYDCSEKYEGIGLFCPLVYHNDKCLSPGKLGVLKNHYIKRPQIGLISSHNMLAITSGVVLCLPVIIKNDLRYDENLNLYGIDLKFCIDYAKKINRMVVFDYRLKHDLSIFDNTEDAKKKLYRLNNNFHADIYISKARGNNLIRCFYIVTRYWFNLLKIKLYM